MATDKSTVRFMEKWVIGLLETHPDKDKAKAVAKRFRRHVVTQKRQQSNTWENGDWLWDESRKDIVFKHIEPEANTKEVLKEIMDNSEVDSPEFLKAYEEIGKLINTESVYEKRDPIVLG